MNNERKKLDPTLVCTCNNLHVADIKKSIHIGETQYEDIFAVHGVEPCCGGCEEHVETIVNSRNV